MTWTTFLTRNLSISLTETSIVRGSFTLIIFPIPTAQELDFPEMTNISPTERAFSIFTRDFRSSMEEIGACTGTIPLEEYIDEERDKAILA